MNNLILKLYEHMEHFEMMHDTPTYDPVYANAISDRWNLTKFTAFWHVLQQSHEETTLKTKEDALFVFMTHIL